MFMIDMTIERSPYEYYTNFLVILLIKLLENPTYDWNEYYESYLVKL